MSVFTADTGSINSDDVVASDDGWMTTRRPSLLDEPSPGPPIAPKSSSGAVDAESMPANGFLEWPPSYHTRTKTRDGGRTPQRM